MNPEPSLTGDALAQALAKINPTGTTAGQTTTTTNQNDTYNAQTGIYTPGFTPKTTDTSGQTNQTQTPAPVDQNQTDLNTATTARQTAIDKENADNAKTSQQILDIKSGAIPLSASEQAQVDGMKNEFDNLINEQKQVNGQAYGTAQVGGYRTGAAEYDPTFQARTIGSIVSAGQQKVASLQIKEAAAISTLTEALKNGDIAAIKDAYAIRQKASDDTKAAIQKTIDETSAKIKDMQIAQAKVAEDDRNYELNLAKFQQTGDQNAFDNAFKIEQAKVDNAYKKAQTDKIYYDIRNAKNTGSSIVTTTNDLGKTVSIPIDVAPYYNVSNSGVEYIDASKLQGTAAEKSAILRQAQGAGYKIITNTNTAADLVNIKDANAKLNTISTIMSGIAQPNWLARTLGGYGYTKLAQFAESDPQKAAAGTLESVGLDILKAISGVQGFRGNQSAIQQVTNHLPKVTDTIDTINSKIDFIRQLITDREEAAVGKYVPKDTGIDQNVNGVTYVKGADGLYYPKQQ